MKKIEYRRIQKDPHQVDQKGNNNSHIDILKFIGIQQLKFIKSNKSHLNQQLWRMKRMAYVIIHRAIKHNKYCHQNPAYNYKPCRVKHVHILGIWRGNRYGIYLMLINKRRGSLASILLLFICFCLKTCFILTFLFSVFLNESRKRSINHSQTLFIIEDVFVQKCYRGLVFLYVIRNIFGLKCQFYSITFE
jgi:hypothetical protein